MAGRSFHTEFRSCQAAYDLVQIAQTAQADSLAACVSNPDALSAAIAEGCRVSGDDTLFDELQISAASPDRGEAFFLATAVLLAHALQDGAGTKALDWYWEEFHAGYETAPPQMRGAILRGWARLMAVSGSELMPPPAPDAFVSTDPAPIVAGLRDIAQAMPRATLMRVAQADGDKDAPRHEAELEKLIHVQNCLLTEDQSWFPIEVIELVSHSPEAEGFVECTALLLIDALTHRDRIGRLDFRWQNNALAYQALPEPARSLVLGGFRNLYESDPHFLNRESKDYAALGAAYLIPML